MLGLVIRDERTRAHFNIALDQDEDRLWFTEAAVFAQVPTKIGNLIISEQ